MNIHGFTQRKVVKFPMDYFYSEVVRTNDNLYYPNNEINYLINKSPLSYFSGYKSVYQEENTVVIVDNPLFEKFGVQGGNEKDYSAVWLIMANNLYLCDIFQKIGNKEKNELYSLMENFLKMKFDINNIPTPNIPTGVHGLIKASWFTDTLYVKKSNRDESLNYRQWQEMPYIRLIFKKGEIISSDTIHNKVWFDEFTLPIKKYREKKVN